MDEENEQLLMAELRRDENVEFDEYTDSEGNPTTGVGHNLAASPLPDGWTFPLDNGQVNALLVSDLQEVYFQLDKRLPWWRKMDPVRQRVICNMCFNMGIGRLLSFVNTLKYMQTERYTMAAAGMLASRWATQVKGRAVRLANMMRTGTC